MRMTVLHVFDMDGTLLRGTTASLEMARNAGLLPKLQALEDEFALGGLSTHQFAVRAAELWWTLRPPMIAEIFHASPWLDGIAEVMADIRGRGEHSIVVTMSPDFFAELLRGFGVGQVFASRFPRPPVTRHPAESDILTPQDKVSIVDAVRQVRGLGRGRCLAYGDSASDLPLFDVLTHTLAVNATPALRATAAAIWDGTDLRGAYQMARTMICEATTQ